MMERAKQVADRDGVHHDEPEAACPPSELSLTLAGVSEDRTRLLLADSHGGTYTLPATPSLRAALRGDASRHGQPGQPGKVESPMQSALRPRDIQARIRSGESAEAVAQAAQTSVDKIMAFVAPVLAERQHVAERAQRSSVRRPAGGEPGSGGRTLGDAVEGHLRALNIDPEDVEWDAWRREDGRWTLTAGYALAVRTGEAHFSFDMPGNYVVLDDEDARWLVGEIVPSPAPARDDLSSVRERRLTSVGQDELPLGDDAIELVSEPVAESELVPEPAPESELEAIDVPLEAFFDDSSALPEQPVEAAVVEPEPAVQDEAPARRTVQKKKGRASVPTWDEIMFGGPTGE